MRRFCRPSGRCHRPYRQPDAHGAGVNQTCLSPFAGWRHHRHPAYKDALIRRPDKRSAIRQLANRNREDRT
ncbi:hypothetical protein D8W73_07470 [Citrobacter amalonaticus]|nr:hypothetical protein [Citrobacter amalonaticus]